VKGSVGLLGILVLLRQPVGLAAQSPSELRAFHDQAVAAIRQMASRSLTPGDTFLTWNPKPGGLIYTVRVDSAVVESSLLRGDGMMGTARVEWKDRKVARFAVRWTRADTLHSGVDSAISVEGRLDADSLRISVPRTGAWAVPRGPWAVFDMGMEEQLIPVVRTMSPGDTQAVAVFRPYHLRWDTLTVSVRDSSGIRLGDILGTDKTHELYFIDEDGRLLWGWRLNVTHERRPLETSVRYYELIQRLPVIRGMLARYETESH
jgi:hypothetical protein